MWLPSWSMWNFICSLQSLDMDSCMSVLTTIVPSSFDFLDFNTRHHFFSNSQRTWITNLLRTSDSLCVVFVPETWPDWVPYNHSVLWPHRGPTILLPGLGGPQIDSSSCSDGWRNPLSFRVQYIKRTCLGIQCPRSALGRQCDLRGMNFFYLSRAGFL